jgi:hypothetical protein
MQRAVRIGNWAVQCVMTLGTAVFYLRAALAGRQPSVAAVAPAAVQGHPQGHGSLQEPGHDTATPGGPRKPSVAVSS